MAKAFVKDGTLYVEAPFILDGKASSSGKSTIHTTTEPGTKEALVISVSGRRVVVQLNAYSAREKKVAPEIK